MTEYEREVITIIANWHPDQQVRELALQALEEDDRAIFTRNGIYTHYEKLMNESR